MVLAKMGKLYYVNRKSEGLKLGQIVRKDLAKRQKLLFVQKDVPPPVDMNVDGKSLTDCGLQELAEGLREALTVHAPLQDKVCTLTLSNNGLTARSLGFLAPVIRLAAADLQDLDLSNNSITICTPQDLEHWEDFLAAFANCRHLRRLNLSGNDIARPKAWESFARIYTQHFRACKLSVTTLSSSSSDPGEDEEGERDLVNVTKDADRLSLDNAGSPEGASSDDKLTIKSTISDDHPRSLGLPSVHIIDISRTKITDGGALFLSYIIERHHYVQNEIEGRLYSRTPSLTSDTAGIAWEANDTLGQLGNRILNDSECVPYHPFKFSVLDPHDEVSSPSSRRAHTTLARAPISHGDTSPIHHKSSSSSRRKLSSAGGGLRRVSEPIANEAVSPPPSYFSHSPYSKDTAAGELVSLRRKLQRMMIEEKGPGSAELWIAALRLLVSVREYLACSTPFAQSPDSDRVVSHVGSSTENSPTPRVPDKRPVSVDSYSSKLVVDGITTADGPLISCFGAAAKKIQPQIFRRSPSKSASSNVQPQSRLAGSMRRCELILPEPTNLERVPARGLPLEAWIKALTMLADPKGVLSPHQASSIVEYGRSKYTLALEQESRGKQDSTQIWKVLQAVESLSYEDSCLH